MFYNKEHNQYVTEGTAFSLGDIQYPANWLNLSSPEEKVAAGLVEVVILNEPKDDRFYWVSQELNGAELFYVNTPKQLDDSEETDESGNVVKTTGLKTQWKNTINQIAYTLLLPSDWRVVKSTETGTPLDTNWATYRSEIRKVTDGTRVSIDTCKTVDELKNVIDDIVWPVSPDAPVVKVTANTATANT